MKVLIFNSGTGSRMGKLTENKPKCLLDINGETILHRQLRLIEECGLKDVIITTGRYGKELEKEAADFPNMNVVFVNNPLYASTNYIYSMYLARDYINDDIIMLHGDLVFEKAVLERLAGNKKDSLCLINPKAEKPLKDFKGRIEDGVLTEVSVDIADYNCYALQPMYKLLKRCILRWLEKVTEFAEAGKTGVYAENALNEISAELKIKPLSYAGIFISEIDTETDYRTVKDKMTMLEYNVHSEIETLKHLIEKYNAKNPFFIMGKHLIGSCTDRYIDSLRTKKAKFTEVEENPSEECAARALQAFTDFGGDLLISIGGGSVIDTAKAVKYMLGKSDLAHIAVPTTAGSGSEATPFSVLCRDGVKYSLCDMTLIPEESILDSRMLETLSSQQRKVSLLDALCHSIESIMSKNTTAESKELSKKSISIILNDYMAFVNGEKEVYEDIFIASYYAGKAICITKTSIGHAMSYSLTTDYGIQHGQAVALCLIHALEFAERNGRCDMLNEIYAAMECGHNCTAAEKLLEIYRNMEVKQSSRLTGASPAELARKVNADRLNNSVIAFSADDVEKIYSNIIKFTEKK